MISRSAITPVVLHSLATLPFPGDRLVVVLEAGDQRVVKLPVVVNGILASGCGHPFRIFNAQRPTANVHLVRSVVERLARAINPEPMPVVGMDVISVRAARYGPCHRSQSSCGGTGASFPIPIDFRTCCYTTLCRNMACRSAPSWIFCTISMECGEERCCVPICTSLPCFCCASTNNSPSAGLWLQGFST